MKLETSKLTRVSFWLTFSALVGLGCLAVYVKFSSSGSSRGPTLEPKTGVVYEPGRVPDHRIVAEFAEVLHRNTGRIIVPESELPHPSDTIRKAIFAAPRWARDFHSPSGRELFGALLVELQNFVASPNTVTFESVWVNQRNAISALGFEFRVVAYDGPRPIPIGGANQALKTMRFYREAQFAGFTAFLVFVGFLGFRLLYRLFQVLRKRQRAPWSGWGFVGYLMIAWPIVGLMGYLAAWIPTSIANLSEGSSPPNTAEVGLMLALVFGFGFIAPLFVSSAIFDLLVSPTFWRRSNNSMQLPPEGGAADADR